MPTLSTTVRDDHDQRFKLLVMEFIAKLLRLFWPEFARMFDFRRVEWLDKEAFPDPPTGKRKVLDAVGKLRLRKRLRIRPGVTIDSLLAIVHVEVEASQSTVSTCEDMFQYFAWLRQKHRLPVLPIALYLQVGKEGIGFDTYAEDFGPLEVLRYNFLYAGLPALDGRRYLEGDCPLGVALSALMRVDDRVRHKALALKKILDCDETEHHKFLLAECVQAYLPLKGAEQQEFETLLENRDFSEVRKMAVTWFEKGIEKGREEGREEGRHGLAKDFLERRFGPLPRNVRERLDACSNEELTDVLERSLRVTKPRDLFSDDRRTSV